MNTSCAPGSVLMPRIRFLVVLGLSETAAIFIPVTALISVDFPTLGLPITDMKPDLNFISFAIKPITPLNYMDFYACLFILFPLETIYVKVREFFRIQHIVALSDSSFDRPLCIPHIVERRIGESYDVLDTKE